MDSTKQAEFERIANLMIKFLAENYHPHVTAIITSNSAELAEGIVGFENDGFIKG